MAEPTKITLELDTQDDRTIQSVYHVIETILVNLVPVNHLLYVHDPEE
jgi:hypothetical protein